MRFYANTDALEQIRFVHMQTKVEIMYFVKLTTICRKIQQFVHTVESLNLWIDFQSTTNSVFFMFCFQQFTKSILVDTFFIDKAEESTESCFL